MSVKDKRRSDEGLGDSVELGESTGKVRTRIHVVVDGVSHNMETKESFAIKFSLLTNMPVTKVKHLMSKMPASLWTGSSLSKAKGLLQLVEEAGGEGRIVEEEIRVAPSVEKQKQKVETRDCAKCGFPLKKDDAFCEFCQSPVEAGSGRKRRFSAVDTRTSIPPARLLFYLLIVFAAIVITLVSRS